MENTQKTVSISKDELAELPVVEYRNSIIVVDNEDNISKAVEILAKQKIIGFDTETKPNFKRGQVNRVSLLQLSTHDECYLIRLNKVGLPDTIKDILENPNILKIGLSIHDDFHSLNKLRTLNPDGFIELQTFVKDFNIHDNSLARIYAILFGQRISKGQRLTNWETEELTEHQQAYAALDAFACIEIYEYLSSGKFKAEDSKYYRILEPPIQQIVEPVQETEASKPEKQVTKKPAEKKRNTTKKGRTTVTRKKNGSTSKKTKKSAKPSSNKAKDIL